MNKILEQYYRKPQVYIALPSQGQFYNSGCKLSVDNQLAVRAMTAADEILLKNPEALLNGEAVINLIKSCCPDITNAEEVSIVDLDAILIAIRHATYGENLQFNSSCNHCKSSNELEIHYGKFLETIIMQEI